MIRPVEPSDYYRGHLKVLSQLSHVNMAITTFEAYDKFIKSLNDDHQIYVYYDADLDIVIGTITLIYEHKLYHDMGRLCHIEDVVVDSSYRGHHIGQKLVAHAIHKAKERNCYKTVLYCNDYNVKFYEKCGLEHKGALLVRYFK